MQVMAAAPLASVKPSFEARCTNYTHKEEALRPPEPVLVLDLLSAERAELPGLLAELTAEE
jgi:hypothetical protein